jgi:hypothetical protein
MSSTSWHGRRIWMAPASSLRSIMGLSHCPETWPVIRRGSSRRTRPFGSSGSRRLPTKSRSGTRGRRQPTPTSPVTSARPLHARSTCRRTPLSPNTVQLVDRMWMVRVGPGCGQWVWCSRLAAHFRILRLTTRGFERFRRIGLSRRRSLRMACCHAASSFPLLSGGKGTRRHGAAGDA